MQRLAVCQHSGAERDGRADEDTVLSDRSFLFCPTEECPELLVPAAVNVNEPQVPVSHEGQV